MTRLEAEHSMASTLHPSIPPSEVIMLPIRKDDEVTEAATVPMVPPPTILRMPEGASEPLWYTLAFGKSVYRVEAHPHDADAIPPPGTLVVPEGGGRGVGWLVPAGSLPS